ncbi:MAG: hypothetical protein M1825_004863 [Sarcosagium campestre]|nr:MAG: hypothetical protein M1825_004863 [Sarcosagium campestre]
MATEAITEEGWHVLDDGTKLYTKTWKPSGKAIARVVFVHGFSDHCNAYYTLFPTLASRGILVHGFDQRGWGRSVTTPPQKGLTGSTSQVLEDITSILSSHLPPSSSGDIPLFLAGHSMGGGEILTYAAIGPTTIRSQITGYIAESPLIAVDKASQPWRITFHAAKLASKVLPHKQMVQRLDPALLSRDEQVSRDFVADELCHDTGTLEGLAGMLDRGDRLATGKVAVRDGAGEGQVRIWVGHGTQDRVTSFEASRSWFERLAVKDKEFKAYEGWYHKLHAEPGQDKIQFANDVADWILARVPQKTGAVGETRPKL